MDEIRARFAAQVAARFSNARDSAAKEELIEELSGDLYLRYQDKLDEGLPEQEAYDAALSGLGDVTELVEYLNSLPPREGGADASLNGLLDDLEDIGKNVFSRARSALEGAGRRWRAESGAPREEAGEAVPQDEVLSAEGLRGIDLRLVNGGISVRFSEPEDGQAVLTGGESGLEISRTGAGVLLIRQGRPDGARVLPFLFLDPWSAGAHVELRLPCRSWDSLSLATANGDVELSGGCSVESVSVKTASGDIRGRLDRCAGLTLTAASGDIRWDGDAGEVSVKNASGDIRLEGELRHLTVSSVSGEIDIAGSSERFKGTSVSGDICFESGELPARLELDSKSGDCVLRLPSGAFTLRASTVSGDVDSVFPMQKGPRGLICGTGGPAYTASTVSGDIRLERY